VPVTTDLAPLVFDRNFDVEPGIVVRLSPLVRRILCGNASPYTFRGTSTFIVGNGTVAIVDPGPDDEAHLHALLSAVRGETVSHILVTHSHADHSPLAAKLKIATGAATVGYGQVGTSSQEGIRLDASVDSEFAPEILMGHGDVLRGLNWTMEGVFTPGHMSNHLCLALREEHTLFAGDHVMAWATSVIAPPDGNMASYLNSLRLLLDREQDRIYYPAHGPARRDPHQLVRAYLAHRRMREGAILARLWSGDRTIAAIVAAIYADIDPKLHGAAALSTRAHLEHLVSQGKAREMDGVYEAVLNL
jgi:glyoxylase-like metal-dependent hydrolase (beta-lactamase superfamily II)